MRACITASACCIQQEMTQYSLPVADTPIVCSQYAGDVILNQTPDTFSDTKQVTVLAVFCYILMLLCFRVVPADERLQRYERVVAMVIAGVGLLLRQVSSDHLTKSCDVYDTLLAEKRLWKLARHDNPAVSGANGSIKLPPLCILHEFLEKLKIVNFMNII